jgi:hypothetical protein
MGLVAGVPGESGSSVSVSRAAQSAAICSSGWRRGSQRNLVGARIARNPRDIAIVGGHAQQHLRVYLLSASGGRQPRESTCSGRNAPGGAAVFSVPPAHARC